MGYYSDPTANAALGNINREFSKLEKKAKKIREQLNKGTLSDEALEREQARFKGLYRHVLTNVLSQPTEE